MRAMEPRIVLITGGSGGLGAALAHAFYSHGHRVVIAARDEAKLFAKVAEITRDGEEVLALSCDVTDRE